MLITNKLKYLLLTYKLSRIPKLGTVNVFLWYFLLCDLHIYYCNHVLIKVQCAK